MFLLDILKHNTHNTDNENICDLCDEKFTNYKDLIGHGEL